jgi:hypothetical protein
MRQYINDLDTYTTMKNAGLNEQLYYVAKVRSEDYGNDENFGYINEAQYSSKPFDYSQPHFEPYQHDYSKYPESNLELLRLQAHGEELLEVRTVQSILRSQQTRLSSLYRERR